ncbi:MAG: thioredoxin fold domain-containing protein [Gammaproteobacteria bacterium]
MILAKRLFALFFLLTLGTGLGLNTLAYGNDDEGLPPVTIVQANNLQADGQLARQRHVPILIMFAQHGCEWCHYVEEDQLKPMLRNADYRAQVIIRQVMLDDMSDITDFDGHTTSANQLASRYNASLTPTVIFVDGNGKQLVPSLVGVSNTELYGGDLDNNLAKSEQIIRQQLAALNIK